MSKVATLTRAEDCTRCTAYQGGDLPAVMYERTMAHQADELHRATHRFRDELLDALPKWYTRLLGWERES